MIISKSYCTYGLCKVSPHTIWPLVPMAATRNQYFFPDSRPVTRQLLLLLDTVVQVAPSAGGYTVYMKLKVTTPSIVSIFSSSSLGLIPLVHLKLLGLPT